MGGRFGFALSSMGDINRDGYDDLAVGAPHDSLDGKGAVYVYHGSRDGIVTSASQIVSAADVGGDVTTFGYSLSGGKDQDDNLYPGTKGLGTNRSTDSKRSLRICVCLNDIFEYFAEV